MVKGEGYLIKDDQIAGDAKRLLIFGDAKSERNSVTLSATVSVPVFFCGVTVKNVATENCSLVHLVNPENTSIKNITLVGSEKSCRNEFILSSL